MKHLRLICLFILCASPTFAQLKGFSTDSVNIRQKFLINGVNKFGIFANFNSSDELTTAGIAANAIDSSKVTDAFKNWVEGRSRFYYPGYSDFSLDDYIGLGNDSVVVCVGFHSQSSRSYLEVQADTTTGVQTIHGIFTFIAPMDVSDVGDTLIIVDYATSNQVDTDLSSLALQVFKGETSKGSFTPAVGTQWTRLGMLASYGSLSDIKAGDLFTVHLVYKVTFSSPNNWVRTAGLEMRWR